MFRYYLMLCKAGLLSTTAQSGLMYSVKKHDRLAVSKLLAKYTKGGVRSPYATCLLVSGNYCYVENNTYNDIVSFCNQQIISVVGLHGILFYFIYL